MKNVPKPTVPKPTVPKPTFLQLTVTVVEDLHTGAGTGSGDIDACVQRDRHGQPVIRSSHFKGLLREASDELFDLLSGAERTKLDEARVALLGAQGSNRGKLRLTSLYNTKGGKTMVWGATGRALGKRQPEGETLRFVEHVQAGTSFTGRLRVPDSALRDLLERLLKRIDRIGGNRNRGAGLAKLEWNTCSPRNEVPSHQHRSKTHGR